MRQDKPDEVAASKEPGVVIVEHQVAADHTVHLAEPYPDVGKP